MEGSSSSSPRNDGKDLASLAPRASPQSETANAITVGEDGEAPQDPAAKKRAANREYSQRYRQKQNALIMKLEGKKRTLEEEVANNCKKIRFQKELEKHLDAEEIVTKENLFRATLELQAKTAMVDMYAYQMERMKLFKEALQAQTSNVMKFQGQ